MNFAKLLRTTFYIPPVAASVEVGTYFDLSAKKCAVFEDLLVFRRNTVMPDFEFLSIVLESYFLIISIFLSLPYGVASFGSYCLCILLPMVTKLYMHT